MRFRKDMISESGAIARTRTCITVASDRLSCNQEELLHLQNEITEILSKYMNLDDNHFELRLELVCRNKRGVRDVKTIQIK